MSSFRTTHDRRRSLVERLAEIARDNQGGGTFDQRVRSWLIGRPDERETLADFIEELVASDPRLDVVGPTVIQLLRSSTAAAGVTAAFAGDQPGQEDVDDSLGPDDVLRIARVRGQAQASIFDEPRLEAAQVAEVLGSSSRNPREFVRQVRGRSSVLAVRLGNRYVFPAFQFNTARHEIWPLVAEVNALLGARDEPWAAASFWFSPNPDLDARPADLVADGDRSEEIRQAARRDIAPVG